MSPSSVLANYTSREQIESILEGAQDTMLKGRGRVLPEAHRDRDRHWVQDLILNPSQNFQIIHVVERNFLSRYGYRGSEAFLRP